MNEPNVLLVIMDSVRARNTSLHGHGNETTPFLEQFATESTVFEQARSPGIHSIASHASIFTGYHVDEHRMVQHDDQLAPGHTIWESLRSEHDYQTGLFTPNVIVSETSNLAAAFDDVDGPRRRTSLFPEALRPADVDERQSPIEYAQTCLTTETPGRALANGLFDIFYSDDSQAPEREHADIYIESFLDWERRQDGPWAACLNLMDAHYPYLPNPSFTRWGDDRLRKLHRSLPSGPMARQFLDTRPWWELGAYEALYDDCIRQLDDAIERLVETLRVRGLLEETLLVITSDHGEAFGERSRLRPAARLVDHSWGIHEVLTHVPLIIREPGQSASHRVESVASLASLPAVINAAVDGRSARGAVDCGGPVLVSTHRAMPDDSMIPSSYPDPEIYYGPWRAVYHQDGTVVEKNAANGPDGVRVVVRDAQDSLAVDGDARQSVSREFTSVSDRGLKRSHPTGNVDGAVEQKLQDLGYL